MKKKGLKGLMLIMSVVLAIGVLAGCGGNSGSSSTENSTNDTKKEEISGSITLAGSTALQPLAEQIGKSFAEKNPKATVNVQGGGSGTGLNLALQGTADIGNSDVTAESKLDAAKAKELVDHKVCAIGFAVVVNPSVKVDNLTKEQIQKIFTG